MTKHILVDERKLQLALEALEKHYPYEDESGIIKMSLGRYMNGVQYLRLALYDSKEYNPTVSDALMTPQEIEDLHRDLLLSGKATWFPTLVRAIESKIRGVSV